jgi:N-acetylglutamate synthase-like GNAT family acetyltransferase
MNTAAGRKDPKAVNQLISMLESGMSPAEAAKRMEFEAEKAAIEEVEGPEEDEVFADEIKVISQALAFRKAEPEDLMEIMRLFNAAYSIETGNGEEAFRKGDGMSVEVVISLFDDKSFEWLVVEAPNGHAAVRDGTILGVCVYSSDGVSRRNGEVEGKLGSIRLLAVLPQLRGFCIGMRLLKRVESNMFKAGCVRCLTCIPSARASLEEWFEHRGYRLAGVTAYPAAAVDQDIRSEYDIDDEYSNGAVAKEKHLRLLHMMRKLEDTAPTADADGKKRSASASIPEEEVGTDQEGELETVLQIAGDLRKAKAATGIVSDGMRVDNNDSSVGEERKPEVVVPGKMHLPPHWRHAGSSDSALRAALNPAAAAADLQASGDKGIDKKGKTEGGDEEEIPLD